MEEERLMWRKNESLKVTLGEEEQRRDYNQRGRRSPLALAGFGGGLHLPLFGDDCHVKQSERQYHHHENECHELTIVALCRSAKITVVPAQ